MASIRVRFCWIWCMKAAFSYVTPFRMRCGMYDETLTGPSGEAYTRLVLSSDYAISAKSPYGLVCKHACTWVDFGGQIYMCVNALHIYTKRRETNEFTIQKTREAHPASPRHTLPSSRRLCITNSASTAPILILALQPHRASHSLDGQRQPDCS